ncbi:hypothetical protein MRS76_03225 [Rhizobiaceae bacterium n13]|uniref:Uncharacterized protein n=1 Tax=Ferirhizobium litorale TaxID=2927786 RepID=A0AAE3QBZ7_9HYPH|nr:hypothetical protein [Fererhizobium litorale]MDI7860957.1 hypothetical protein [Fererhizobium litorale]MDI7921105.1 hypothetical protein [Fererhizobium litorale]
MAETISAEIERGIPGRKRRDATLRRRQVISNVLANLVDLRMTPGRQPGARLAVATAKKKPTRYDRADYPQRILADTLLAMEEVGAIHRHDYTFKRHLTTVEPTADFQRAIMLSPSSLADIGRGVGAETIWLAARSGERPRHGQPMTKVLVSYRDTSDSCRYRAEVETINAYLRAADITFDGRPQVPVSLRRGFTLRSPHETPEFNLGGRLFGGFWMNISSRERYRLGLRGEPVADLDYSAMFARLAYLRAGQVPPNTDPYEIPGLEAHRTGAKVAMLSLLSRSSDMKQLTPELRAALPEGWTAKHLREAAARFHPRIAQLFGTDVGIDLMFAESQLLVRLLLELAAADIPALPMHDGLMVPVTETERVAHMMRNASVKAFGVSIPVKEKEIWWPNTITGH